MKRAIISVSNKEGVVPFAQELVKLGFEIISTHPDRLTFTLEYTF